MDDGISYIHADGLPKATFYGFTEDELKTTKARIISSTSGSQFGEEYIVEVDGELHIGYLTRNSGYCLVLAVPTASDKDAYNKRVARRKSEVIRKGEFDAWLSGEA